MEQWEYLTLILEASARDKQMKTFISENFEKKAKRHSPEAMIPELNELGKVGWEMIHMEPVPRVGGKEDVRFDPYHWSNSYFCVLKRRLNAPSNDAQAISAQASAPEAETEIPPIQLDPNRIPY
ncbi:MAG: hypothetical protein ACFE0Q_03180 [Anaerolineae bacterium]